MVYKGGHMNAVYEYVINKLNAENKSSKDVLLHILKNLSDADIMWLITKKIEGKL